MQGRDDLAAHLGGLRSVPERALWLAVLDRMIGDLAPCKKINGLSDGASEVAKKRALSWLDSESFGEVCDLAGVNADWVRPRIDYAIKNRAAFRAGYQQQHYRRAVA